MYGHRSIPDGAASSATSKVAILLALYNGADFLREQLDSLVAQSHGSWSLTISDDGSQDDSRALAEAFAAAHPDREIRLIDGPRKGPAANFRHLLAHVPHDAGFVAFCDQDDIWMEDKLARAIGDLAAEQGPAIWCSRAQVTSDTLTPLGLTPAPRHPPSFTNALIQNIVIGHTLTLNRAAFALVAAANAEAGPVVMHDWWIYQLVSGAGGRVVWSDAPSTLYRQHRRNAVGGQGGAMAQWAAMRRMGGDEHQSWNRVTLAALAASRLRLTPENRAVLDNFAVMQGSGALRRLAALRRSKIRRQTTAAQSALWLSTALGWL